MSSVESYYPASETASHITPHSQTLETQSSIDFMRAITYRNKYRDDNTKSNKTANYVLSNKTEHHQS